MDMKTIGKWALVVGIAFALINAFVGGDNGLLGENGPLLLAILGLVAGIFYLSTDDATGYYILTAAVLALASAGGGVGDLFGLGEYVGSWMAGSSAVLTAGAAALVIRTFVSWAMP